MRHALPLGASPPRSLSLTAYAGECSQARGEMSTKLPESISSGTNAGNNCKCNRQSTRVVGQMGHVACHPGPAHLHAKPAKRAPQQRPMRRIVCSSDSEAPVKRPSWPSGSCKWRISAIRLLPVVNNSKLTSPGGEGRPGSGMRWQTKRGQPESPPRQSGLSTASANPACGHGGTWPGAVGKNGLAATLFGKEYTKCKRCESRCPPPGGDASSSF